MRILLTNDDGINAMGINVLFEMLSADHDVTIIAPDKERSAASHSVTLGKPLNVKKLATNRIAVYGTPTDCVLLGVYALMDKAPDIILSGINHGPNLGDDVMYSGTVGAALEGAILEIPSVSISFVDDKNHDLKATKSFVIRLVEFIGKNSLPPGLFLNVNICNNPKGVRITKLGKRKYINVVGCQDKERYVIKGIPESEIVEGTDVKAVEDKYISVTPLKVDLTSYESFQEIQKAFRDKF
ncbi:MAG TPA: 5'/3'-nucleotidase SurE [bacterium (Candidatus Stahlbacteria)]|nr:5'/3'-nucleotidase SurE [Candidatus Stahlbacteria bacterium]